MCQRDNNPTKDHVYLQNLLVKSVLVYDFLHFHSYKHSIQNTSSHHLYLSYVKIQLECVDNILHGTNEIHFIIQEEKNNVW